MYRDEEIESIRKEFPALGSRTYLNSAAHGPTLRRVHEAVKQWWMYRLSEDDHGTPNALGEAAKLLHCDTGELCWANRVSQGLNMVASMMPFNRGDNIVVTDLGYQSNVYVWLPFRNKGVEIRRISHRNGLIETSDFEKAIDDNTKVTCVSRVEWTSGIRYDMKALSELSHQHGAYLVDDGYQAVGATDVDLHRDDVDFFTAGSEKWLCCPMMIGFFYIKKELIPKFEPTYRNYHSVEDAFKDGAPWEKPDHDNILSYDKPLYGDARKFYRGCVSDEHVWGFDACLSYFNELGIRNIQKKTSRLSQYLIEALKDQNVKINTPEEPNRRAALVTYDTGSFKKNQKIYDALKHENVDVAHRYEAGVGGIRVSCHFFNTEQEIDKLIKIQRQTLSD
jgi:cysteine desulfurase/selenocysteine lyase